MARLNDELADVVGGFLLARKAFNYVRAKEDGVDVRYRGKSYCLEGSRTSKLGYALGVMTRPLRILNFLLDVPQEFFEGSKKS